MSHREGVDIAAIVAAFETAVEAAGPGSMALAKRVWARLDTDRWTLEWQLPLWLGSAFGLDPSLAGRLVTSNVLGLASVRIADDLADGEIAREDAEPAGRLAAELYRTALAPYRERFDPDHAFWSRLEAWMAEWRRATDAGSTIPTDLAARGAPLRIPALAISLIGGREAAFPALERCLDHSLAAMVLYDHACDWREDVAADRWNAFAAGHRDARRVEAALLSGAAIGPYFARIDRELDAAAAIAAELGVGGLAAHLADARSSIDRQGRMLEARCDALGTAAARLVFGQLAT